MKGVVSLPDPGESWRTIGILVRAYERMLNQSAYEARETIRRVVAAHSDGRQPTYMELLGIGRKEKSHSRFLRWLLDPRGSHGLGDGFLRLLLSKVDGFPYGVDLMQTEVRREKRVSTEGVRLLDIELAHPSHFLVGVENKIGAPISVRQLADEAKDLKGGAEGRHVHLLLIAPRRYRSERMETLEEVERLCLEAGIGFQHIDYDLVWSLVSQSHARIDRDGNVKWILEDYAQTLKGAGVVDIFEGFHPAVKPYIENFDKIQAIEKQFRDDQQRLLKAIRGAAEDRGWSRHDGWMCKLRDDGIDFFKQSWNGPKDRGVKFHIKVSGWKLQKKVIGISLRTGPAVDRQALKEALMHEREDELTDLRNRGFEGPLAQYRVVDGTIPFGEYSPVEVAIRGLEVLRPLIVTIDSLVSESWRP